MAASASVAPAVVGANAATESSAEEGAVERKNIPKSSAGTFATDDSWLDGEVDEESAVLPKKAPEQATEASGVSWTRGPSHIRCVALLAVIIGGCCAALIVNKADILFRGDDRRTDKALKPAIGGKLTPWKPSLPRMDTTLCSYRNFFNGKSIIHLLRKPPRRHWQDNAPRGMVTWTDQRFILMDGQKTNRMHCKVVLHEHSNHSWCQPPKKGSSGIVDSCHKCPCDPIFNLTIPVVKSYDNSPYALQMCKKVVLEYGCQFKRAALVGFGIGVLPTCLLQHCPTLNLTIVDIDGMAEQVGRLFFGWQGKAPVVVQDGLAFFQDQSAGTFDLVMSDCFNRLLVPEACRSQEYFAAIKTSMRQNRSMFAINTLHKVKWQRQALKVLGPPSKSPNSAGREGQWFVIKIGWRGQSGAV